MATGDLMLPNLPHGTANVHVMPNFVNNLLSMGVFCDADCTVTFTKLTVTVVNKDGKVVLNGFREPSGARMWRFNLEPPWHPFDKPPLACSTMLPHHLLHQSHLIPDDDDDDSPQPQPPPATPSVPASLHRRPPTPHPPALSPAPTPPTTAPPTAPARISEFHRKAYDLPSTRKLVEYLHCTAGSPVKSQFLKAVKAGNFKSFPGLSVANVSRYCPLQATPTVLGHMTQVPQGLRSSTRTTAIRQLEASITRMNLALLATGHANPLIPAITPPANYLHLQEFDIATLHTDDTGRFPIRAMSGNQYIMVAYHDIANVILVQPFQSKADRHRIPAYNAIMARLNARGLRVDHQTLDNEASDAYKQAILSHVSSYQLVPPDMHRRNKAERAIRTFKAHFLSILASVDPSFPKNRWDTLLPQAEITVNLLRQSHIHPSISAWEHFNGPFNFDATPMGPPGSRIISHAKGSTRKSWDYRGNLGHYVGPALEHYRCFKFIRTSTQAVAVSDTIVFQHPTMDIPTLSTADRIIHCLRALTIAIRSDNTPDKCHSQLLAIESLRAIFSDPTPAPPTTTPLPATPPRVATPAPSPRVVAPTSPPRATAPALSPRVVPTAPSPSYQPIAHRTRASTLQRLTSNTAANVTATPAPSNKAVSFTLAATHIDKDSTAYRKTKPIPRQNSWSSSNHYAILADDDDHDTHIIPPPTCTAYSVQSLCITDTPSTTFFGTPHATATAMAVLDHESGVPMEHRQLRKHPKYKTTWDTSYANELGRLSQGVGKHPTKPNTQRVPGTNSMHPIKYGDIPHDRKSDIAHTRVVCTLRPTKADPERTRITIGGNTINYTDDCGTKTASLETCKLVINSTLSTPNAKFMSNDLANFYLNTPLDRPEYIRIKLSVIPQEIIDEHSLLQFAHNGWIYYEITKGMYGLKQAGKLANDLLSKRLFAHGYYQCDTTPGLWRHKWRPIIFALIVDDFGVQYTGREHAEHLLHALNQNYEVTSDWTGSKFAGIDLAWDYNKRSCRLSMNGYIKEVLIRFGHPQPTSPQHSPHRHRPIVYGAKAQYEPTDIDTSPPLPEAGIKRVQGIVGSLLYYARAVDPKLLCTLSAIGSQQAAATQNTTTSVNQLLDHVATYPNDGTTYTASDMILAAHSDAGYLNETKSRSRAGAHIFLSNNAPIPQSNGPVLSIAAILKSVYGSAAEAELAALYKCAQEMVPLRNSLNEMGWPQPPSPIQVDNSTAVGYVNNTITPRRLRSLEMRINWLKCRESQEQFRIFWDKGSHNLADYHTKHHPPEYHLAHRHSHAG